MVINKPTMQHTIDTMFSMSCSQPAVVTAFPINAPNNLSELFIFETSFRYDEFSLNVGSHGLHDAVESG